MEVVARELQDRDEALRQLKFHLHKAQEQMKYYADQKKKEVNFAIGDWVYLKLRPHRQASLSQRIYSKLSPRYYSPFQIIDRYGEVVYKLHLPPHS